MTFALDLNAFADKYRAQADDAVGLIVVKVAEKLDLRSPVGDARYWKHKPPKGYIGGHFRANWQLGVGVRPTNEIKGVDRGGQALGRIMAAVPEDAAGKVYWLANNAPYAQRLEHGWSRQAPQGLVGLTVAEFQQIVRDAVAGVR